MRDFLAGMGMTGAQIERVAFLVSHHHTLAGIDSEDWQILVEADFIANASENGYDSQHIQDFLDRIGKTASGKKLIREVFFI